ncbi:MAG: SIS domain-containing protein, partial [Deltaproteobacteria bacterium]|nr:SIS domain-containing protein [Deltaproteobacteria bacterium]
QLELSKHEEQNNFKISIQYMREAILKTVKEIKGSFAAVIIDPVTQTGWALKHGSSLYAGIGKGFILISSDLSSILKYSNKLIPLEAQEFIEFNHQNYSIFKSSDKTKKLGEGKTKLISAGTQIERKPVRSKLRYKDTQHSPKYDYFMEQEIHAQTDTVQSILLKLFGESSNLNNYFKSNNNLTEKTDKFLNELRELDPEVQLENLTDLSKDEDFKTKLPVFLAALPADSSAEPGSSDNLITTLNSTESALLSRLFRQTTNLQVKYLIKFLDSFVNFKESRNFNNKIKKFSKIIREAGENGRHIYLAACGTSYHAAMSACLFFNEIAWTELIPILPGEFRGRYSNTVKNNDVVIAISQSGETKDLVDILNDIEKTGKEINRIAIVNNLNSTIAQEKSDLTIPLHCGPEIAVPATKSFINQITILYVLALEVARQNLKQSTQDFNPSARVKKEKEIQIRLDNLKYIPELIDETIKTTQLPIEDAARDIFLAPSIQILATKINSVAKEGSLKIREVVLNHTEGFEGAEFKHGPNTILGKNTIYGVQFIERFINNFAGKITELIKNNKNKIEPQNIANLINALTSNIFGQKNRINLSDEEKELFNKIISNYDPLNNSSFPYPLIYITGPEERDTELTVSQINTHKIRGANTIIIAEENSNLRSAAETPPANAPHYKSHYIALPRTGDTLLTIFSSTVVLQMLALEMSVNKMKYLDQIGIIDHGVHPDVPKNVSKSITVD